MSRKNKGATTAVAKDNTDSVVQEALAPIQEAPAPVAQETQETSARHKNGKVHIVGELFNGEEKIKDFDTEVTAINFAKGSMYLNWALKLVGIRATFVDPTKEAA